MKQRGKTSLSKKRVTIAAIYGVSFLATLLLLILSGFDRQSMFTVLALIITTAITFLIFTAELGG